MQQIANISSKLHTLNLWLNLDYLKKKKRKKKKKSKQTHKF